MIRDDIIRMAREANMPSCLATHPVALERFAALVRSDEREACARVVMSMRGKCWAYDHDVIAEAILARGKS